MAGNLARISPSSDNIIELDTVRPGRSGRASADRNLCPDLCPDFSASPLPRKVPKSSKKELTPALIDDLRAGKLDDSKTGALSIEVIRIASSDGRSLLGREIRVGALGELGSKLGLELGVHLPPDELAATVLRTGRPIPFDGPEPMTLKRSLVNGSQRLELAGFSASRLSWYKAQGCFTEIIRYQTRLFVPVDGAGLVLARLELG